MVNFIKTLNSFLKRRVAMTVLCLGMTFISCFAAPPRNPERGYRGFLEIGPAVSLKGNYVSTILETTDLGHLGYFMFNTSHGFQFNNNWFIGAGIGINMLDGIPLFVQGRYDFNIGKATPFVDFRVIYNFFDSDESSGMGFAPTIGYRFNWGRKLGLNIGLGFTFRDMKVWKGHIASPSENLTPIYPGEQVIVYDEHKRSLVSFFNLRVGIDF